ncbi:hypothetical protein [Cellulosilyticum ruminicola]|uniref:hypothetical protein n=1 Tax=Cellulosilyticum ruminicola TaxID=425254 RepID=UPI0012ED1C10|nr:hypothetical protein [Cellulosilyticum ruminicola]
MLPYEIVLYQKDAFSKIEIAANLLKELPHPVNKGYVLADSWYSCAVLFNAAT